MAEIAWLRPSAWSDRSPSNRAWPVLIVSSAHVVKEVSVARLSDLMTILRKSTPERICTPKGRLLYTAHTEAMDIAPDPR